MDKKYRHPEMERFRVGMWTIAVIQAWVTVINLYLGLMDIISERAFYGVGIGSMVAACGIIFIWYENVPSRCTECNQIFQDTPWSAVTREDLENGTVPIGGKCPACRGKNNNHNHRQYLLIQEETE